MQQKGKGGVSNEHLAGIIAEHLEGIKARDRIEHAAEFNDNA